MAQVERPLSPHLQIYRPQITSVLSILHRITGIGLALGALVLAWWLVAAAYGPGPFGVAQEFLGSIVGRVFLFGFTLALFFHLCNGIRHLFWDAGIGFELRTVYMSGWLVVIASIGLSLFTWIVGYAMRGGS
jgi:succinate dehydrogenase / fumarate reductase cytochrome b subunit